MRFLNNPWWFAFENEIVDANNSYTFIHHEPYKEVGTDNGRPVIMDVLTLISNLRAYLIYYAL